MPKEIVNSTSKHDEFYLQVGWNKETGDVQVATVNPKGKLYEEKHFEADSGLAAGYRDEPLNSITPGWFVNLDRAGINRLIKALRVARDQSFGKDE